MNDFWFDIESMKPVLLITFFGSLIVSFVSLLICYGLCRKFNKEIVFQRIIIILTGIFLCIYIHSNFLSNFLPALDGSIMDWGNIWGNITSIAICILILVIIIICTKKRLIAKTFVYSGFVVGAIFLMLMTSFISTAMTTDVFVPKAVITTATTKNLNLMSNNKNYMILLVDAVDSQNFNGVVKADSDLQDTLKDFSYFPDTVSGYAFTRDSVPFIFSGIWNTNEEDFNKYSTKAFDNSAFFKKLHEEKYNSNLYNFDYVWQSREALKFNNIYSLSKEVNKTIFVKQELKYILFKTLPFPLKRFSKIEEMDFAAAKIPIDEQVYYWDNIPFYSNLKESKVEKTDEKYFQYVHIEGGHVPFDLDENVNEIPEETGDYVKKLKATAKIITSYINRLKENGAYDNSVIIVMADHGFENAGTNRQNPILYVKGINESHANMVVSEKQVSYADLANAFMDLLDDKKSTEIFSDIETSGRVRRFIWNGYQQEENMQEYESTGKAWELDKLQPTGKVFSL